MTKVVQRSLPNGTISTSELANPQMKRAVMLLSENIKSLATQLAEAQQALLELQGRTRKTPEEIDVDYVLQTASKDATTKANAAQSAAISTAAADATTKANAAQSAAISTAAADATAKVDTHANNTNLHVTTSLKNTWNAKYSKPSSGIPKTDLASAVQTALTKAESALTSLPTHAYTHKTEGADALTASDIGAAPAGYVTTQSFTASVGSVSASSNSSTSVSVALTGYTPVLVGTVYSKGNNSSGLPAAYRVVALSLSGSTVNLTLGATMNMISDTVTVGFTVLYTKNS